MCDSSDAVWGRGTETLIDVGKRDRQNDTRYGKGRNAWSGSLCDRRRGNLHKTSRVWEFYAGDLNRGKGVCFCEGQEILMVVFAFQPGCAK